VGTFLGVEEGVTVAVGLGGMEGSGVGDGSTAVDVSGTAEGKAVGVGSEIVTVAVGRMSATNVCSCMPNTTATNSVKLTRAAARSPLKTGPSPLPKRPWPGLLRPWPRLDFILSYVDLFVKVDAVRILGMEAIVERLFGGGMVSTIIHRQNDAKGRAHSSIRLNP
jgi:hypothetical protein